MKEELDAVIHADPLINVSLIHVHHDISHSPGFHSILMITYSVHSLFTDLYAVVEGPEGAGLELS